MRRQECESVGVIGSRFVTQDASGLAKGQPTRRGRLERFWKIPDGKPEQKRDDWVDLDELFAKR